MPLLRVRDRAGAPGPVQAERVVQLSGEAEYVIVSTRGDERGRHDPHMGGAGVFVKEVGAGRVAGGPRCRPIRDGTSRTEDPPEWTIAPARTRETLRRARRAAARRDPDGGAAATGSVRRQSAAQRRGARPGFGELRGQSGPGSRKAGRLRAVVLAAAAISTGSASPDRIAERWIPRWCFPAGRAGQRWRPMCRHRRDANP